MPDYSKSSRVLEEVILSYKTHKKSPRDIEAKAKD